MECIIKKEQDKKFKKKILKPLSEFEHYIEEQHASFPKNNKKYRKGLVLCHGHKHSNEIISKIKFIEHWYMVDIDKNTHPDYIADAANSEDMSYFPDNFFDSILTEYCTVIDHEDNLIYDHFLKNCHRILKKNSVLCSTELPKLFFWFLSKEEFNDIVKKIDTILGEDIQDLKKKYIENATKNMYETYKNEPAEFIENLIKKYISEKSFYYHIMRNHYNGPKKNIIDDFIKEIKIKYTINFLARNNFIFIGIKGSFLFAEPIKN